jgi:hypothetical protein
MKPIHQRHIRRAVTAAVGVLIVLAGAMPVNAQMPGGMGGLPSPEMMQRLCADHDARINGHMAFVESKVGIKPEQRAAWDQFVSTAKATLAGFDPYKEGPPPFNDPVAMRAKFDLMMEKGAEVHKLMKGAADQFAAVLDPEQQRKFAEAILPHPMMGMPGMRPPG